jgi:transcriptional regulator with XRE-family HTH domain
VPPRKVSRREYVQKYERPLICARIQAERMRLRDTYMGPGGNPFTQEAVARRVPTTLKTYRTWERNIEPDFKRLRQIAAALELPEDYFLPQASPLERQLQELQRTVAQVVASNDALDRKLKRLEQLLRETNRPAGQSPTRSRAPSKTVVGAKKRA